MTARRALWTTSWCLLASLLAHELLARVLDDAGLIERLLSPTPGLDTLLALLAAAVLYGLRLALYFVLPGALAAMAVLAAFTRRG